MKRLVVGAIAVVMALGVIGAIRITAVNEGISILDVIDPAGAPETTGATNPTPQPRFPVRIRIRDASGAPVADATVEIRDRFGGLILDIQPTDARGELRFTSPPTTGVVVRARKAQVGQVVSEPITLGPPGAGQSSRDIDLSLSATATIPSTAAVPTTANVAGTRPIASPTPSVPRTPMAGPATALVQTPTRVFRQSTSRLAPCSTRRCPQPSGAGDSPTSPARLRRDDCLQVGAGLTNL